jgi:hypothetical protein
MSCGTGGKKGHCSSPDNSISSLESIGFSGGKVYPRGRGVARHPFVRTLVGFVWLMAVFLSAQPLAAVDDAAKIYDDGRKAERAGQMARAYLLYSQAAALDPSNQLYWLKSQAVQSRAASEDSRNSRQGRGQPRSRSQFRIR